jgi:hypothetical protein
MDRAGHTRSVRFVRRTVAAVVAASVLHGTPVRAVSSTATEDSPSPHAGVTGPDRTVHDVHVSVSRVVLENGTVSWRIRCFADDLERALRGLTRDSTFSLKSASTATVDALFARYFSAQVQLQADGQRATPRVVARGTEADEVGGPVQWYVMAFDIPPTTKTVRIRHAILFDVFGDQQNLVTWLDAATGRRQPLYFTAGNDVPQSITRD